MEDSMESRWRDNVERDVRETRQAIRQMGEVLAVVHDNTKALPERVRHVEDDVTKIKAESRAAKTHADEAKADKKWLWGAIVAAASLLWSFLK